VAFHLARFAPKTTHENPLPYDLYFPTESSIVWNALLSPCVINFFTWRGFPGIYVCVLTACLLLGNAPWPPSSKGAVFFFFRWVSGRVYCSIYDRPFPIQFVFLPPESSPQVHAPLCVKVTFHPFTKEFFVLASCVGQRVARRPPFSLPVLLSDFSPHGTFCPPQGEFVPHFSGFSPTPF